MCRWMDESKAQGEDADFCPSQEWIWNLARVKPREGGYWDVSRRKQVPQEDNQRDIGRMLARK